MKTHQRTKEEQQKIVETWREAKANYPQLRKVDWLKAREISPQTFHSWEKSMTE